MCEFSIGNSGISINTYVDLKEESAEYKERRLLRNEMKVESQTGKSIQVNLDMTDHCTTDFCI